MTPSMLLTVLLLASTAQESTRTLDKPGEHHKHLTIDTVDRWLLDGVDDEILRVDVRSGDFDPVLELVRVDDDGRIIEVLIPEVDDPGSESHMLLRLPSGGPLAILVHGPENRGGGRYRLYVERLRSEPLPDGAEYLVGRLDGDGNAHVRVMAEAGDVLVPRGNGVTEVLDPKGFSLGNWRGCYAVERSGEHYLRMRGAPKAPFRVGLATVPRRVIEIGSNVEETIEAQGLDEWTFETRAGGVQLIELVGVGLEMRVLKHGEAAHRKLDGGPAHRWIPTHSKGSTRRAALIARVAIGQRLQIRSSSDRPTPYRLELRDASVSLPLDARSESALPIGGSHYWTFAVEPGQVLSIDVDSGAFDPVLKLYDAFGVQMVESDDSGGDLAARHSWLVTRRGQVHAEVLSHGNGGGGAYAIELTSRTVAQIAVGERQDVDLAAGAHAYWHLELGDQKQVLVLANSDTFQPGLTLYDPDGIQRAAAWSPGEDGGVLLNLRRPGAGRYTLMLSGRRGGGACSLRVLDPDE